MSVLLRSCVRGGQITAQLEQMLTTPITYVHSLIEISMCIYIPGVSSVLPVFELMID